MQKNKSLYDSKIMMIDLNFHFIDDGNLDILLSTQKILKKLTASQNLILLTDCAIDSCIAKIANWNLTSGYLVANSGAVLYNLATKAIVSSCDLDKDLVHNIIKQAIWNNLNFVINTKESFSYVYQLNTWLISKYKFDLNRLFELESNKINEWVKILKIIEKNSILSVEILFYEKDDETRKELIRKFIQIAELIGKFNYCINDATIFIFSDQCSRLKTAEEISNQKNIVFEKNSLYIGIDQLSKDIVKKSYFAIIYDKLLDSYKLESESNFDSVETIIVGDGSWINWLNHNEHLWTEPATEKLKKSLDNYQYTNLKPTEETDLKNNKYKFLNLDYAKWEIFISSSSAKTYSWYKKEKPSDINKIKKLFFWDHQLELILNLLKTKKRYY